MSYTFWFSLPELPAWCCKNGFQTLWASQCFSCRRAVLVGIGWWDPRSLLQDWASQLSSIQVLTPSSSFTSSQAREQQDFWRAALIYSLWTPHGGLCFASCGSWAHENHVMQPYRSGGLVYYICCFLMHFCAHFQESFGNLWSSLFGKHLTLCH